MHEISPQITNVALVNGTLEVVKRFRSTTYFATDPPQKAPDLIFKEIYKAVNGEIVLVETIKGDIEPAQTIPETIKWG